MFAHGKVALVQPGDFLNKIIFLNNSFSMGASTIFSKI